MSNFFEVSRLRESAVDALARGFAILTCEPHDKAPWAKYSPHTVNSATRNLEIALKPWNDCSEANYGVACGQSNLTVLDCDTGLSSIEEFEAWRQEHLPETLTVISGREKFGIQMYFSGTIKTKAFKLGGVTGELKGHGGYVLGAGSIHPSGKKYQIYKDIPIAPLPEAFQEEITLDISEEIVQKFIRNNYWKGTIEGNAIVWRHSNITKFLEGQGLTWAEVKPFIGSIIVKGPCSLCKEETGYSATSRTKAQELAKYFDDGSARCTQCWENEEAAKAEQQKIAEEQAALAKQQELTVYKKALELKHGELCSDTLCPECQQGWLIIRLNSTQMKPFASCSTYNPHKYSCKYSQSLDPELHDQFLKLFKERLDAVAAKGAA